MREVQNFGQVIVENVTVAGPLVNHGVIRGDGRLHAEIGNTPDGEIRVAGGERMLLSGPNLLNRGRVDVVVGELEVRGPVTSVPGAQIAACDATLRFEDGLANEGQLALSFGTTDVFGDVNNTGLIAVAGGAMVSFYDDLVHNGTMIVAAAGSTAGQVAIFGMLSGTGSITGGGHVYLLGGVSPGHSPGELLIEPDTTLGGQSELVMELADEGLYDQLSVSGNLELGGTLAVELIDGYGPALGAEFDLFDWGGLEGEFSNVLLPQLPEGLGWDSSQLYATGSLRVIIEPGSAALMALMAVCAAACLLRRRR